MKKSDNKRQKLLEAAKDVLAEYGLEKATISEIVKRAGVAQGTFYLYFSSKNALIPALAEELLKRTLDEIEHEMGTLQTFWEKIKTLISVTFKVTKHYREWLALCYSGLAIEHKLEQWEEIYRPYYALLSDLIDQGIKEGAIRSNLPKEITIKMLVGLIEDSAEQVYLYDNDETQAKVYQEELYKLLRYGLDSKNDR